MKTIISEPTQDGALLQSLSSIQSGRLAVNNIPSTWQTLAKVDQTVEIHSTSSRVLTALSFKSHSDIWGWFEAQVTEPAQRLAKLSVPQLLALDPEEMPDDWMPNTWIFPLLLSLQTGRLHSGSCKFSLEAKKFFPNSTATDYTVTPRNYDLVQNAEAAVIHWLNFTPQPGMSLQNSRALATLISTMCRTLHGSSFLYLSCIQQSLKRFHPYTARRKVPQASIEWKDVVQELEDHPLASPTSNESIILERLKEFLWTVCGLPLSKSTEMSIKYQEAVRVGGDAGVQIFAPIVDQMYVSSIFYLMTPLTFIFVRSSQLNPHC